MNNTITNPFEMLFRKLEGMEMTMNELKSKLDKIEGGGISTSEPATKSDAAKYLGVSLSTVDNLLKSKQLKPFRMGKSVRFTYEDLDAFIEKKKQA